ncbi:hypothetical protein SDC9_159927 [bioreactor metagenome]|uniref:Uncharacterized protein n=1 Tax=bioreactor metagenome TaxID=1076179 RepID=A0A645FGX9_9ZZZZ|nr:hypothetical protein [Anaerotignum propionicum]MEA5057232.1 hypothetical protein [Anaerotignum propionicum]
MNFGLEDMRNNTILGTPANELSSLAEDLKKSIQLDENKKEHKKEK